MEGDYSGETPDLGGYPSLEKLIDAIQNSKDLTVNERQEILKSLFSDGNPGMPAPLPEPWYTHQTMVLAAMLGLVILVFVFFGYKLIKSIKDKEKKKEEKKKQKQSKKKK